MKKFTAFLTACLMLLTSTGSLAAGFSDVNDAHAWANNAIYEYAARGIIIGDGTGSFLPDANVTRAEFAKMLSLAFHLDVAGEHAYTDVPTDSWQHEYVAKTAAYTYSASETTYAPDAPATRAEIAYAIAAAANLEKKENSMPFSDIDNINPAMLSNVTAAYNAQILQGYPDNTLRPNDPVTRAEAVTLLSRAEKVDKPAHMLDGKRFIFIGNSMTFYGRTVISKSSPLPTEQEPRNNDIGYFYQLCKTNGANVSVTNWTFGGHALADTFGGEPCTAKNACEGAVHLDYLTDRKYDYVVIQEGNGGTGGEELLGICDKIMEIFKTENPDVKFIYLIHQRFHMEDREDILSQTKALEEKGMLVVDWGKMVADIIAGTTQVPGAQKSYNKNTFVVSQTAKDGYHPNMLSGYLTTLMTYCAITGESAVGQSYAFTNNPVLDSYFNFENHIKTQYVYDGATTNFPDVFASETDMLGLQQLVDFYLAENSYKNK